MVYRYSCTTTTALVTATGEIHYLYYGSQVPCGIAGGLKTTFTAFEIYWVTSVIRPAVIRVVCTGYCISMLNEFSLGVTNSVPQIPYRRFHDFRCTSHGSARFPRNRKVNRSAHFSKSYSTFYRIVESTLRTCNNLLERLHASFFFYLFPEPGSFTKIGNYLPSAVVISTAILFSGLRSWVRAGWVEVPIRAKEGKAKDSPAMKWERRGRTSLRAILIVLLTHACGIPLYFILSWQVLPRLVRMSFALRIRHLTSPFSLALLVCALRCCWLRSLLTKSIRTRRRTHLSGCS